MKNMPNGNSRQKVIDEMIDIIRKDSPWLFGYNPKGFGLFHEWFLNAKPNLMAHNTLQYKRINPQLRDKKRAEWNEPIIWPIVFLFVILIIGTIPAVATYKQREHIALKTKVQRSA